ncbi:acyl-CoA dehydrogenase family protein [Spectribacter hydrogenooxidans]|uniref:Acyl-CoA dehydrogenase family protein n=1 Tax=Spectribacter hydrogenoxidans TaxID=3075608 RepID=A0ABU3C3H0_9GAMM|nr:acyl-CoA dehydrogenase family protein [Salinisphaera sp. W335]MDT0636087.1 acyl-CoA dehydrogenase family protein [Salinisphaera sp. W335]
MAAKPASPYYTADHELFRDQVRRFVAREIEPHIHAWDEAGRVPREFFRTAAEAGLLALGYPEELGGTPVPDYHYHIVFHEEIARAGSGGIIPAVWIHGIACPPIVAFGTDEQKNRFVKPVLAGDRIAALAVTEPGGGSDVANLQTVARRDGDDYIINGSKTFISGGMRADHFTVAVRTGEPGLGGVSMLVVEADSSGFSRTELKKMGWWCSDTATLHFDDCRVPAANLIGMENAGFAAIMHNFNHERLGLSAQAYGLAQCCLDEATDWAKQRQTFGKPLIKHQVIRHKLVDMATRINATKATLEALAWRVDQGETPIADICMLKNLATGTLEFCANEAVQIFGGMGYMRETKVERIYRETKVMSIGGGATEIMKDLAARQMGF